MAVCLRLLIMPKALMSALVCLGRKKREFMPLHDIKQGQSAVVFDKNDDKNAVKTGGKEQ